MIRGAGCLTLVCVFFFFFFGFLLAMLYLLRTDGKLLGLCDHGNWPCLLDQYGQREYWVERPGWFFIVKTTTIHKPAARSFCLQSTAVPGFEWTSRTLK